MDDPFKMRERAYSVCQGPGFHQYFEQVGKRLVLDRIDINLDYALLWKKSDEMLKAAGQSHVHRWPISHCQALIETLARVLMHM